MQKPKFKIGDRVLVKAESSKPGMPKYIGEGVIDGYANLTPPHTRGRMKVRFRIVLDKSGTTIFAANKYLIGLDNGFTKLCKNLTIR